MQEQRAEALQLAVGKPASLMYNGSLRPITREPLSDAQIQGLVREIASPDAASQFGTAEPVAFAYRSPYGEVRVELKAGANGLAVLRPASAQTVPAPAVGSAPGVAAAPSSQPSPSSPSSPSRSTQDLSEHRASMDVLFRTLVQSGASDLHLRSNEPPMLRVHGELARQDQPALPAERVENMLLSIMTAKEIGEFREGGDTDWAYEIEGLARFRCNAGRDRYGAMGVFRVIPNQIRTAEEMGLSQEVQNLCYLTKGLVVVTGPTGSGKSTTLAGLVDLINRTRTDHIITIEDPIEFVHPNKKCLVHQREIGTHASSFAEALKAAGREDPDLILVGEMRDVETISMALCTPSNT